MAWSVPFTYTAGAVLTAAQLNTYQSGNMNQTAPAKMTTAGDLVYASAANTITRLAASTSDKAILTYTTTPTWTKDMTSIAVDVGSAGASTGTLSESPTYTNHASATFTLPTGWASAEVTAWGSMSVTRSDNNQRLNTKMIIGTSTGTVFDSGIMHSKHDMTGTPMHKATVTANSTVKIASTIVGSTINTLRISHASLAYVAVRKS